MFELSDPMRYVVLLSLLGLIFLFTVGRGTFQSQTVHESVEMSGEAVRQETQENADCSVLKAWKILTKNNSVDFLKPENEQEWRAPWYFIQGADPQYGLIERYINNNPIPNWDKEIDLTERLVEKINKLQPKPRFFVICGDLCDAEPTQKPHLFNKQERSFKRIFGKVDSEIPILVVCGNHDVGNNPAEDDISIYRNSWGDDYYSFWCGGIFFVVANTQYYVDPVNAPVEAEKHKQWLEAQLKIAKSKSNPRVIMLQHIPWFLHSADETDSGYFAVSKEVRDSLLDSLVDAGVQKVFTGHYHRNAGGMYKNMEVVVTSAIGGQLGSDESGVRLVKVYKDKIEHQYFGIEELTSNVDL